MKRSKVIVLSRKSEEVYTFVFKIHKSDKLNDRQIEAHFYEKLYPKHRGTHYEIEIESPDVKAFTFSSEIHYHVSEKNGKTFICYILNIKTKSQLSAIVNFWCKGTVHTIETGEDFTKICEIHKIEPGDFRKLNHVLNKEYGIKVVFSRYSFS